LERNHKIHRLLSREVTDKLLSTKELWVDAPELHVGVSMILGPRIWALHVLAY